jgi:hypothetical protein
VSPLLDHSGLHPNSLDLLAGNEPVASDVYLHAAGVETARITKLDDPLHVRRMLSTYLDTTSEKDQGLARELSVAFTL